MEPQHSEHGSLRGLHVTAGEQGGACEIGQAKRQDPGGRESRDPSVFIVQRENTPHRVLFHQQTSSWKFRAPQVDLGIWAIRFVNV